MAVALFRTGQSGAAVAVGPLEAAVLDVLWDHGAVMPVPDVHRTLNEKGRDLSYSAVKAVLNNLAGKGILKKDKVGKVTRFEPVKSRADFDASVLAEVIGGLERNYGTPAIARLVGGLAVDEAALDELERIIAERRAALRS